MPKSVVIIGALGKDFHTFNMSFKEDKSSCVLAFTVAGEQNIGTTGLQGRRYPGKLAGPLYPKGIPMILETDLEEYIREHKVDEVVFSYSDVSHEEVMHKASRALAAGADFRLITPSNNQIQASVPMLSVVGVRTGCGKSQVSRAACRFLKDKGFRVVAIREPMPYGDLIKQQCMRFACYEDMDRYKATIEEREEYEPYIEQGLVVYSGVDYEAIVKQAEQEADVIVWDGGNNEVSFYVPDLLLVVADALRPGAELKYHPGEVNARSADVFVINKVNACKDPADIELVTKNLKACSPSAKILKTDSVVSCSEEDQALIKGKRCVVVEDGPTCTHGSMAYGAGFAAMEKFGGIVSAPRSEDLVGGLQVVFNEFPHLQVIVPAMGYTVEQRKDLEETLNRMEGDVIVNGSPLDLARLFPKLNKPVARVVYDVSTPEGETETLSGCLQQFVERHLGDKSKTSRRGESHEKKMKK